MSWDKNIVVLGFVYLELMVDRSDCDVPSGKELFCDELGTRLGGAFNTAEVAKELGARVTLAFPVGDGLSDRAVLAGVRDADIEALTWRAKRDTAVTLVLKDDVDRAFLSRVDMPAIAGAPQTLSCDHVHVAGLREAEGAHETIAGARSKGSSVSVSGSWAPESLRRLSERTDPMWDYLFLNREEAIAACGTLERAAERLQAAARNVVVTLGSRGIVGCVDEQHFETEATHIQVPDPTGAGDAFVAGFLAAHQGGARGEEAARCGAQVAAEFLVRRNERMRAEIR